MLLWSPVSDLWAIYPLLLSVYNYGNKESLTEIFLCLGGQVEAHAWETRCGGQELCCTPEVDARASAGWHILRGDHLPSRVCIVLSFQSISRSAGLPTDEKVEGQSNEVT